MLITKIKPINEGNNTFITHKVYVEANISILFTLKWLQICNAISPRVTRPNMGGKGMLVWRKKKVAMQASPVKKGGSMSKNIKTMKYCKQYRLYLKKAINNAIDNSLE